MKHDKKKYLKKTVVVTASTMLAVNSVLASPLLLNVSAAEETRVTQRITKESKIDNFVKVTAKSEGPGTPIGNSLDGNPATFTDSDYNNYGEGQPGALPQVYTFELSEVKQLSKVRILPRGNGNTNGRVASYKIKVSNDGATYTTVLEGTLDPNSETWHDILLNAPVSAKFVQLELRPTDENFAQVHVVTTAEVELYETITVEEADKSELESLYNQSKDFQPHFNQSQDYFDYFQGKLVEAKTVLDNPSATQEEVNSKVRGLTQAYYIVLNLEFNYKYGISVKDGSFTNPYINYSEYLTSDLRSVMQVRYESANHLNSNYGNNTLRPEENQNLINWYNQFVEADKNLVKADSTNLYGKMVGLNPDATDATARGTFEVSEEKEVIEDGKKKIQLHVVFKNDAKHPITNTIRDKDNNGNKYEKWKSGDLKNFSISMDGESYTGETDPRGSISVDDTNAYDGVEFDVVVEPGIYRFKLQKGSSVRSATPGYYHTNLIQEEEGTVSSLINGEKVSGDSLESMIESSGIKVNEVTSLELTKGTVTQDDLAYLQELSYLEDFKMIVSDELTLIGKDGNPTTVLSPETAVVEFANNRDGATGPSIKNVYLGGITEIYKGGLLHLSDAGNKSIEELYLPDVVEVGDDAFESFATFNRRSAVETIDLSNAVHIGERAFSGLDDLDNLILKKVEKIGKDAFVDTDSLKKLTLPETIKELDAIGFHKRNTSGTNKSGTVVTILATTPPTVTKGSFVSGKGSVVVPHGYLQTYIDDAGLDLDADGVMSSRTLKWNELGVIEDGSIRVLFNIPNESWSLRVAFVDKGQAIGNNKIPSDEAPEGQRYVWNTKRDGSGTTIDEKTVVSELATSKDELDLYRVTVEAEAVVNVNIDGTAFGGETLEDAVTQSGITPSNVESIEFVSGKITPEDLTYLKEETTYLETLKMNLDEDLVFVDAEGNESTKLPSSAFKGTRLVHVELAGFTEIGASAFNGATKLKSVSMPDVEIINSKAFYHTDEFVEILLPQSIKELNDCGFDIAKNGKKELTVTMEATTPPTITGSVFSKADAGSKVIVPNGALQAYLPSLDLTKTFKNSGSTKWAGLPVKDANYHYVTFYTKDDAASYDKEFGYVKADAALNSIENQYLEIPEGLRLASWNTKEDGSGTTVAVDAVISEDMVLYPQFVAEDPIVSEVFFENLLVDNGSHIEIELNAKPGHVADPIKHEYVFEDGKHVLKLDDEDLATDDYFYEICLWGNDANETAIWSYIYRDENGKLSVGKIEDTAEPEVILNVGDNQYDLNENPGSFIDPFDLPEAAYIGVPITVDVKAPYIDECKVQLVQKGPSELEREQKISTNHQTAIAELVSSQGKTTSGTYCITVKYNRNSSKMRFYHVKVDYSKKTADKSELQKLYDEASAFEPEALGQSTTINNLNDELEKAKAILEDATATQEVVDAAYETLNDAYLKVQIDDLHTKYEVGKNRFDFNSYTTESLKTLVYVAESAWPLGSDSDPAAVLQSIKDAEKQLVEYDGSAKTLYGIADGALTTLTHGGHFEIVENTILDKYGNRVLQLKITFHNDGIDYFSGKNKEKYSDLAKGNLAITYVNEGGTTSRPTFNSSYFRALDGSFENGITINVTDIPANTEIVGMEIHGTSTMYRTSLPGHYRTGELAGWDTILENLITKAEALDELDYTNKSWDAANIAKEISDAKWALENNRDDLYERYAKALNDAINSLVKCDNVDYDAMEAIVKEGEAFKNDKYTVESWRPYRAAISQGREIVGKKSQGVVTVKPLRVTQEEFDAVLEAIETNKDALVDATNMRSVEFGSVGQISKAKNGGIFTVIDEKVVGKVVRLTVQFDNNGLWPEDAYTKLSDFSSNDMNEDLYIIVKNSEKDTITTIDNEDLIALEGEDDKEKGVAFTVDVPVGEYYFETAGISGANQSVRSAGFYRTDDKIAPEVKVTYSNNNGNQVTADDVVVTLTANEAIKDIEGWTRVADNVLTKTFDKNGKHTVIVTDLAGNTTNVKFEVKRIDKTAPVITGVEDGVYYASDVTYGIKEQSIRKIYVDGVAYDEKKAPRTISEEGKHTIRVVDKAGNEASVSFVIDKTKPVVKVRDENGNAVGSQYTMTLTVGDEYFEFGALVNDNLEGEVVLDGPTNINYVGADGKVVAVDVVDTSKAGEYRLGYLFTDKAGNKQMARRIVKIVEKEEPEVPVEPQEPDPEVPVEPENPETPDTPETPETPEVPDVPETPDTPTPQEPGVEVEPINPIVPETPTVPQTPGAPAVVVTPVQPRLPVAVVDPQEEVDPVEDPEVEPENIEDPDTPQGGGEDIDDQETPLAKNDGISMEALLYSGLGLLLLVAIIVGAYEINKKRKAGSN